MNAATAVMQAQLRRWLGRKGFAITIAVALIPVILTGAWMLTHQADLESGDLRWDGDMVMEGDEIVFSGSVTNAGRQAVGSFNASMMIGTVSGNQLFPRGTNTTEIDGLGAGETADVTLTWTAQPGMFWLVLTADPDRNPQPDVTEDDIGENDEFNNQAIKQIVVHHTPPAESDKPAPAEVLTGDPNATTVAALSLFGLTIEPANPAPGTNVTVTATVRNDGPAEVTNATASIQIGRAPGGTFFGLPQHSEMVNLSVGQEQQFSFVWEAVEAVNWVQATIAAPMDARDANGDDNHATQSLVVDAVLDPDAEPPAPPELLTIKDFYLEVLTQLQLRVVVPFIALFYAVGVLADERRQGNLVYILTRPVPRWSLPVTRFASSFLAAAVAVTVGAIVAFLVLFRTPGANIGFLISPLLGSLLALLTYTAGFVLLGVLVDRPYWWGIGFVIGWESIAPLFLPWVGKLTVTHHVVTALQNWPLDDGVHLMPEGAGATAARTLVFLTAAFLVAAATFMKRREFDVS